MLMRIVMANAGGVLETIHCTPADLRKELCNLVQRVDFMDGDIIRIEDCAND